MKTDKEKLKNHSEAFATSGQRPHSPFSKLKYVLINEPSYSAKDGRYYVVCVQTSNCVLTQHTNATHTLISKYNGRTFPERYCVAYTTTTVRTFVALNLLRP